MDVTVDVTIAPTANGVVRAGWKAASRLRKRGEAMFRVELSRALAEFARTIGLGVEEVPATNER